MKTIPLLAIIILTCIHAWANDPLEVGKPCPDVQFNDVQYYKNKQVSVGDFKGKCLVLDFFSRGCVACFQSLAKMNDLRKEFKDKMEVVLVAHTDEATRNAYERFRKKQNLDLPVAVHSSVRSGCDLLSTDDL